VSFPPHINTRIGNLLQIKIGVASRSGECVCPTRAGRDHCPEREGHLIPSEWDSLTQKKIVDKTIKITISSSSL